MLRAHLYRWTDVYSDFTTGNLQISSAAPLFDDAGTSLLGVSYSSHTYV